MSAEIVVYAPSFSRVYPAWLSSLPEHVRARSGEGLFAALARGGKRGAIRICLLMPVDLDDLSKLAGRPEVFSGWKVVLELPDESPEALKVARPLSPRFFAFRRDNQSYLAEVVRWIAEHPTGLRPGEKPPVPGNSLHLKPQGGKDVPCNGSKI